MSHAWPFLLLLVACPRPDDPSTPDDTDAPSLGETSLTDPPRHTPDGRIQLSADPVPTDEQRALYGGNHSVLLHTHDVTTESRDDDAPCVPVRDVTGGLTDACVDGSEPAPPSATPFTGELVLAEQSEHLTAGEVWTTRASAETLSAWVGAVGADGALNPLGFTDVPACQPDISRPREDLYFSSGWIGGPHFRAPNNAFDADGDKQLADDPAELAAAQDFLRDAHPHIPFGLPFRHEDVSLGHGWFYDSGSNHRGLDYSRSGVPDGSDPTFEVVASADGIVRRVMLMNAGGGNVVVIEHPRAGGPSLWSLYMHLRNGKSNDQAAAAVTTAANPDSATCAKYALFLANPDYADHPTWGQEWHTIRVKEGDVVKRGEVIGFAGNTGCGGIGAGLADDGTPNNLTTANTHLHMYYARTLPGASVNNSDGTTSSVAVYVDAYGAYTTADADGCYELGVETPYPRVLAPFDPVFHEVSPTIVAQYLGYYYEMGYGPRSVTSTYGGGQTMSGVMGPMPKGTWAALVGLDDDGLDTYRAQYAASDFRLDHVQRVTVGGEGRWSVIFRQQGDEQPAFDADLDSAGYLQAWSSFTGDGAMLLDYDSYEVDGAFRTAALWLNPGRPFRFFRDRSRLVMDDLVAAERDNGWKPLRVSVHDDDTVSTTFVQDSRDHFYAAGISASTLDVVDQTLREGGFNPDQLQAYDTDDGVRYVGTWARPAAPLLDLGFQVAP